MDTATVLWNHAREHDLCPGAQSFDEWWDVRWIKVRIRGRSIPFLPVIGYRNALHLHDVHHVLTGYSTKLPGELELAAWELASGGCGLHLLFWPDRLLAIVLGLVVCPIRLLRAAARGWRCRNLYRESIESVLASDFEDLRRRTRIDREDSGKFGGRRDPGGR